MSVSLLDCASECDLAVHGKVVGLRDRNVVIEVRRAWKAEAPRQVVVDPFACRRCMEPPPRFALGDEVVLFLTGPQDGVYAIAEAAEGRLALPAAVTDEVLAAVDRLVAIAALDEDGRNRAMLDLATSKDTILRREALWHISARLSHSELRDRYHADLIALLDDEDPETRSAALQGLRWTKAPEALEKYVALTRDPDLVVVQMASKCLAAYDTDLSLDALVALTRHEKRLIRERALMSLGYSRKPQARAVLFAFLDDPDPRIREHCRLGVLAWLREREHEEATVGIARVLVEETSEEARAVAADLAFETRDPILVAPVLHALDEAGPGSALEAAALRSLLWFQTYGGAAGKRGVESQIGLIRRSVLRGSGGTPAVEILFRAGDRATLREASRSHPDALTRAFALTCLRR